MTPRLPEAPGPTWAWAALLAGIVGAMAYMRLSVYPDRFVPLAYGLPLLLFVWRRDLRLLWGTSGALGMILVSKMVTLLSAGRADGKETLLFGFMQLTGVLVTAAVVHLLIRQSRALDRASAELHASFAELEASNEELAAREEEIGQQNVDLQSQAVELEQQAEELGSQAEELQALNDQLLDRERMLDEIITLSAAGAGEEEVLANLGRMVERLFAPRAAGAAILAPRGGDMSVYPLFGVANPSADVPADRSFASIVTAADAAAYVADLAQRPDILLPRFASGDAPSSIIAAPARVDGVEAIVLEVYSRDPGAWSDLELQLMQWSAEQCGRLWTTARLREDLARLADSERAARTQAERAAREKDEFVATLAHELRTPIGAVLGWSSLLRTIAKSPQELEKGLEVIERNARQQSRLISDLLDMSRAVNGKLLVEFEAVNLSEAVDAAIDVMRPTADAREIALVRDDEGVVPMVYGDAVRLQQVMSNVLTNALKFTPRGGSVRVTVSCDDTHARVTIVDTGKGIRPELIPLLFDRYRQADSSSSRSHGGLGLGLAIARHLVDLHDGSIRLHSDGDGCGTTCVVSLPLLAAGAGAAASDGARAAMEEKSTGSAPVEWGSAQEESVRRAIALLPVLVVDDDADTLEFVARLLEEYGAQVSRAGSAGEALATLQATRPRFLISDIGMPEMDGYELIRRVRQQGGDGTRAIPAIAMTAFTRPNDRARALEAGFHAHVAKPVDPATLVATVARLCGETTG